MVRPFPVLNVLSVLIVVFALAMLLPLCVSLGYGDAARNAYEKAVLITFVSGAILWVVTRSRRGELQTRDGFLLVALVWTVLPDRKSTRLNSSHLVISYAVFCLKKKKDNHLIVHSHRLRIETHLDQANEYCHSISDTRVYTLTVLVHTIGEPPCSMCTLLDYIDY